MCSTCLLHLAYLVLFEDLDFFLGFVRNFFTFILQLHSFSTNFLKRQIDKVSFLEKTSTDFKLYIQT